MQLSICGHQQPLQYYTIQISVPNSWTLRSLAAKVAQIYMSGVRYTFLYVIVGDILGKCGDGDGTEGGPRNENPWV